MEIFSVKNETRKKLTEIKQAGADGAKAKRLVEEDRKLAKEAGDLLRQPSKHMTKFVSAMQKLNIF